MQLMQDEQAFLHEVNEYRRAFNVGKVDLGSIRDFLMCLNCLLAVFNGQKAAPQTKKDIYVDKLSEPNLKEEDLVKEF